MNKKGNIEKLNKLAQGTSTWSEKAQWRSENEDWLNVSFQIAIKALRALRTKGMSQKDLARHMKVSPQYISKILKGSENLSLETIAKLENALHVTLIRVTTDESERSYDPRELMENEISVLILKDFKDRSSKITITYSSQTGLEVPFETFKSTANDEQILKTA